MKITSIKKLQEQFVGKVCTVLTTGIAKGDFADHQFADFFTGIVENIDEDGVFTRHHVTGCKNFYTMQYIVGIIEEQVIDENNPEYQNIVEDIKKNPPKNPNGIIEIDPNKSPFIDPATLASLQKQAHDFNKKMIGKNQP
jgi:hypothetical protein